MKVVAAHSFWTGMSHIHDFLEKADALHRYEDLLDEIDHIVIPNLQAFPQLGKPYIGQAQQSTEALMAVAKLPRDAGNILRQYIHRDFIVLYALSTDMIHIVAIRHHNEGAFKA